MITMKVEKKYLLIENNEKILNENFHNIEKVSTPTPISANSFSIFIKCNLCKIVNRDFFKNEECLKCILKILMNYPKTINIIFEKGNEFYKFNKKTFKNLKYLIYDIKSLYSLNQIDESILNLLIVNPSEFIEKIIQKYKNNKKSNKFLIKLKNTKILSKILFNPGLTLLSREDFFREIFNHSYFIKAIEMERKEIIKEYKFDIYYCRIYSTNREEKFYEVFPACNIDEEKIVNLLAKNLKSEINEEELFKKFGDFLNIRLKRAYNFLKGYLEENNRIEISEIDTMAKIALYKSIRLPNIMPLIMDEEVEEFFLDDIRSPIYLDHREYGRCVTNLYLEKEEIEAFKTRCKLDSGYRLDEENPSLKTEIITKDFHVRVSIDIPPISFKNIHLCVRKLRKKAFVLPELISNGTITCEAAAYLLLCLLSRKNIGIVGESGAGKTTLANALLSLIPSSWRCIYLEDVIESIDLQPYNVHQVRLRVSPVEAKGQYWISKNKTKEIIKLLHRSPTYVFLGEVQTKNHTKALFHAIAAGIKTMFTVHASSIQQLMRRWTIVYDINPISLMDLDILVFISRLNVLGPRKVLEINMINKNINDFTRFYEEGLIKIFEYKEDNIIQKLLYEDNNLNKEFDRLKKILDFLSRNKIFDLNIIRRIVEKNVFNIKYIDKII
jgi:type IV secretory pathway ATPase VirB11/archaellum biosynthesis ATPase